MRLSGKKSGLVAGLALLLLLALIAAPATSARAATEDVAMFYDALSAYGNWVDYGNYGPVWYPTQGVTQNWRPYVDGRWVPTDGGWVFETGEPWGWATYHWGNWMPTSEYGWVWSPGSTWYPSTAAWRTNDDYVGWAPIPPDDYVPEPEYAPAGGYYPGEPVTDLLSAPFWIFAQAANFLLGFNQPYLPAYSYYNTGYLAPYNYVPFLFGSSLFLSDFYYPGYAHNAFYCYGPSFPYVSRVTNINITNINNFARSNNFRHIRGGLPSSTVMGRSPWIRDSIPGSVRENGRFQAQRVANPATAGRQLAHSGVMKAPGNVPALTKQIPKGVTPKAQPATPRGGAPGVAGPRGGAAGVAGPKGAGPSEVGVAPRGPSAPRGVAAPGGERATTRAPAHELRAPTRAPTGEFRAPGREQAPAARATRAPAREFRAPSRGMTMPPSSTHEISPQMNRQIHQYQRSPSTFRPSAPAPSFHAPAAAPRMAPSAPRAAPSAPAPRPSAPAAAPHPSGPAPGGGGEHHR
jgi:hypothetical protein